MEKRKLNYRFHNPNTVEDTAEFLCKLFVEVNAGKVERAIQEAALKCAEKSEYIVAQTEVPKVKEEVVEEIEEPVVRWRKAR